MTVQGLAAGQARSYFPQPQKSGLVQSATARENSSAAYERPQRIAPVPLRGQFAVLSYSRNAAVVPEIRVATVDEFV